MSFLKKLWTDRVSENPTRRILRNVETNEEIIVDVARNEGEISQEGDAFSAENMNDLEQRIADEFNKVTSSLANGVLTYNPETDHFGMNYGGEWHDIFIAGLQTHYLYKDGQFLNEATGYEASANYYANGSYTYKKPDSTNNANGLTIGVSSSSGTVAGAFFITPSIDFSKLASKYSKIAFKITNSANNGVLKVGLRDNKNTGGGLKTSVNITTKTIYLPITSEDLYVSFELGAVAPNSTYLTVTEIWLE